MKVNLSLYPILFVLVLSGCINNVNLFSSSSNTVTEYYKSGEIRGTGVVDFHLIEFGNYRSGLWKEYYKNGQVKATGNYVLSSYTTCCIAGPCEIRYSYRTGPWIFYHENGIIHAKGTFKPRTKHLETTCKGGDEIDFGLITDEWEFFNEAGTAYTPTGSEISLLEQSGFIDDSDMEKFNLFFNGHIHEDDLSKNSQQN